MEGIQVSTEVGGSRNQISIIKVGGYIDTTTSSEVERALNALLKQGRYKIIVDLGNVDYISSAGWGIFISEIKTIRENYGDLKLVRMIPDVYEIFELLEFHHILDVYDSVEEAIEKFEESERLAPGEKQPLYREPVESTVSSKTSPQAAGTQQAAQGKSVLESIEEEIQAKTPAELPLEEKIRYIVAHNPTIGSYRISKKLNTLEFGYNKIGWFNTRKLLKELDLDTKQKRLEFARNFGKKYMF